MRHRLAAARLLAQTKFFALSELEGLPAPVQLYFRAALNDGQVMGSADAQSALQMALRHLDLVNALVLLMPLAYKPPMYADSASPLPHWVENAMMRINRIELSVLTT